MSNRCVASSTCPGGNCVGCRNGSLYCNDPRCYPNCSDCGGSGTNTNRILTLIILILLGVLLVLVFIVGYDWHKSRSKAMEPKNVTVNRHIYTQTSPKFEVPSTPVLSAPVSYDGVNLTMEGIPK